jgi:hypothetical protein
MRRTLLILLAVLVLAGAAWRLALHETPGAHPKVILLGLDGASWNVLDPLLDEGVLPHFEDLRQRGVVN